jgi:mannose-1-phosphate guanylyltransferase
MNVMMLAAGLGARLRPYTFKTPKPAIPFMSVPLACYPLALLQDMKIDNLVVNLHHLPDQIQDRFQKINWPAKNLCFSDERNLLLGSGGAIRNAEQYLKGRGAFIYCNADEVILPHTYWKADDLIHFHKHHKGIATVLCMKHPDVGTKFGGVWVDPQTNEIKAISKTKEPNLNGLHFTGVILFSDAIFDFFQKGPNEEEKIWDPLHAAFAAGHKAYALEIEAEWFETGNPEDFMKATEFCCKGLMMDPKPMWAENLAQVIRLHSTNEFVIENDFPATLKTLQNCIEKIRNE